MSWENNFNSYDNNYNNDTSEDLENTLNNEDDQLNSLLGDESPSDKESSYESTIAEYNTTEESYSTDESNKDASKSVTDIESTIAKVDAAIQRIPNGTSNEKVFSVKDIYRINNVLSVFNVYGESVTEWVLSTLGINTKGKMLKKAIEIAQMDKAEFDSQTIAMSIIKSIHEVDNPSNDGSYDQVASTMNAINQIMELSDKDKYAVISLVKSMVKDLESDKKINIKSSRTSPETNIFSEIREVLRDNPEIASKVSLLDSALTTLRDKAL